MKKITYVLAGALASLLLPVVATAADFRLLHSWDRSTDPSTALVLDYFVPKLREAIPGTKITSFGPEAVPPFEQMEPARAGVFQFLFTHTAYHFGTTRGAFGNDAIDGTAAERRAAGIWDEIDRQYQKFDLKLIAMMPVKDGFHFQVTKPLKNGTFDGMAIRGTQVYHGVIKYLGGAPVVIPIGEVYSALERGVVQGAASPVAGSIALNWNSVAKHLVRPRMGSAVTYLFMNLAAFNALPDDQKQIVLKAGQDMEEAAALRSADLIEKEERALLAAGSTVAQIAPEKAAELRKVWADSLFDLAAETSAGDSNRLREVARKAGLTP
jgi:TRAP-type mannitol/chloroaromatic compound transport system substrate-binding protein